MTGDNTRKDWHGAARAALFKARRLQTLISAAKSIQLEENYGTPYTTGQTPYRLEYFLDVSAILTRNYNAISNNHGIKRAERFAQWCLGRQINTYSSAHRYALYADIDSLRYDIDNYYAT